MKGTKLASDIKFYTDYFKWIEGENRGENWADSVKRVMNMHRNNPKLQSAFQNERFVELFNLAEEAYLEKLVLGSQRALQFGGDPIMKHNAKMFNCLGSYCDRIDFFQEAVYWLLCGCGIGFSVQKHHVAKLPLLKQRTQETAVFVIPDSIEGWADAFGVLMESYFGSKNHPEDYYRKKVIFDYSQIRPKGAKISGGFKAPGPDGLRKSLERCERLLEQYITKNGGHEFTRITPIVCYDLIMHMSDAVLSGGVRRSSCICLFSLDDEEMMKAKTPENYNPDANLGWNQQRARSNNSVVLHRGECTKEQFQKVFEFIQHYGEPGFYFVDDYEQATNPCVEIGFYCYNSKGESGWQGCNLTTGNGSKITTKERLMKASIALSVLGTIQATYTDFKYIKGATKEIFEQEALIGCSIAGWTTNPNVLLNEQNQQEAAELVKAINKEVAEILGINQAARTTCTKPDGNSGVLLETVSGANGDHSDRYFRVIQVNKETEVAKYLFDEVPELLEESIWSASQSDYAIFIPVVSKEGSILKEQLIGVKQLELVRSIQQNWVEHGTNVEQCTKPYLRHNVSNTVIVDEWEPVIEYLWEYKQYFSGVSFLPKIGDKVYCQAPFSSVLTSREILDKYGDASMFASGLVVDGLHVFDNLWQACDLVMKEKMKIEGTRTQVLLKRDWVKRAKQFAKRYFKGNTEQMTLCLKDVHLFHKWCTINRILANKELDLTQVNLQPVYIDVDTLGAQACAGGACEVTF